MLVDKPGGVAVCQFFMCNFVEDLPECEPCYVENIILFGIIVAFQDDRGNRTAVGNEEMIVRERACTKWTGGSMIDGEGVVEPEEGKLANGGAEEGFGGSDHDVLYGGDGSSLS